MSYEILEQLQAAHAFDPAPRRADLGAYHVPFQRLGAPRDLEQALLGAAVRAERVAIIGRSGCGKSSLLASALGPMAETVAPVPVRVAPEPAEIVTSVQGMAAHITQTIVDQAELVIAEDDRRGALEKTAPVRSVPPERRGRQVTVGAGWMGLNVAGQLQRQQLPVIEHTDGDVPLDHVIAPEAVDTLHELYRGQFHEELRPAIRTVHVALTDACDDTLDQIPSQLITTAAVG